MNEHSKKIAALIYRHLQGKLDVQERSVLEEWIAASDENALLFKKLTDKGIYAEVEKDFDDARLVAAAERLSSRVGFKVKPYTRADRKAKWRRQSMIRYSAVAAAVVLLVLAGVWLNRPGQPAMITQMAAQPVKASSAPKPGDVAAVQEGNNIVAVPRGKGQQVMLPDGSRVWLNAESTLDYPARFTGGARKLTLLGEAYFEVAPDKAMPFVVLLKDGTEITVLGTHFSVRAYKGEASKVSLLEGGVRVGKGRSVCVLNRLEQATIAAGGKIDKSVVPDSLGAISWKNGTLTFANADIHTFTREISRAYNIDIKCEGYFKWFSYSGPFPMNLAIDGLRQELSERGLSTQLTGATLLIHPA